MAVVIVCDACGRAYHISPDSGVAEIPCSCGRLLGVPGLEVETISPPEKASTAETPAQVRTEPTGGQAPLGPQVAAVAGVRARLPRALWIALGAGLVLGALTSFAGDLRTELWTIRLPGIPPWAWFVAPGAGVVIIWLLALDRRLDGLAAAGGVVAGVMSGVALVLAAHSLGFAWRVVLRIFHDAVDWRVGWALISALSALAAGAAAGGLQSGLARLAEAPEATARKSARVAAVIVGGSTGAVGFTITHVLGGSGFDGGALAGLTLMSTIIGAAIVTAALDVGARHGAGTIGCLFAVLGIWAGSILESLLGCSGVLMLICLIFLPIAGGLVGVGAVVALGADGRARKLVLGAVGVAVIAVLAVSIVGRVSPGARQVRALMAQAAAADRQVQTQALNAIKRTTDRSALPALLAGLEDENEAIAAACAEGLGSIGDPRAVDALGRAAVGERPTLRPAAIYGLARIGGASAVAALLPALRSKDRANSLHAARALGAMPQDALEPMLQAAASEDAVMRELAIGVLGQFEDSPEALRALSAAVSDADPRVRGVAIISLAVRDPANSFDEVVKVLKDPDPGVRRQAVRALGHTHSPRAVSMLVPFLRNEDAEVAAAAATSLGRIGGDAAVEALAKAIFDQRQQIARAAAEALRDTGGRRATRAFIDLVRRDARSQGYPPSANYVLNMKGVAFEEFVPLLADPDESMRSLATNVLSHGDATVFRAVVPYLSHRETSVRLAAADVLSRIENPPNYEVFFPLLTEKDLNMQNRARSGLAREEAVPTLVRALDHKDVRIAVAAADLLGMGKRPAAFDPLVKALGSSRTPVAQAAALALGRWGDPRAGDALLGVLQGARQELRPRAAVALGQLRDTRALEPLIAALEDTKPEMRRSAAEGLGGIADPKAIEGLIAALSDNDEDVRREAARALGNIGEPASDPLAELVDSEDEWVREGARAALSAIQSPRAAEVMSRAQPRDGMPPPPPPPMP